MTSLSAKLLPSFFALLPIWAHGQTTSYQCSNTGDIGLCINGAVAALNGAPGDISVADGGGTINTTVQLGWGQRLHLGAGTYKVATSILYPDTGADPDHPQFQTTTPTTTTYSGAAVEGKGVSITFVYCPSKTVDCFTSPNFGKYTGTSSPYGTYGATLKNLTADGGLYTWRMYGQHQTIAYVDITSSAASNMWIEHNEDVVASVPTLQGDNLTTVSHVRAYLAGGTGIQLIGAYSQSAGSSGQNDYLQDVTIVRYGSSQHDNTAWGLESNIPFSWEQGFTVGEGTQVAGGVHLKAGAGLKADKIEFGSDYGYALKEEPGNLGSLITNSLMNGNKTDSSTKPAASICGTGHNWSNVSIAGAQNGLDFGLATCQSGGIFTVSFDSNTVADIVCGAQMDGRTVINAQFNGGSGANLDSTCGVPSTGYAGLHGSFNSNLFTKVPSTTFYTASNFPLNYPNSYFSNPTLVASSAITASVDSFVPKFDSGANGLSASKINVKPMTFSALLGIFTCLAADEGAEARVTDSTVTAFGVPITGGGTNHVHAYCNGTNWVVD